MQNEVLQCYFRALNNYCKKKPRVGCSPTFFTWFRHSFREYSQLDKLRKALEVEQDVNALLTVVMEHFISKESTFHNHSFNNYLLDELNTSFTYVDWDCFTPKAVKKYTAPLYRGDSRAPKLIFESGFEERQVSDCNADYLKYNNGRIGISTSKDIAVAMTYPIKNKGWTLLLDKIISVIFGTAKAPPSLPNTYVYAIDYRGPDGFDILKTGQARGLSFSSSFFHPDRFNALNDKEVNIKGAITPEQIAGAFEFNQHGMLWIENSKYVTEDDRLKMKFSSC